MASAGIGDSLEGFHAVRAAVENGEVQEPRYRAYLRIMRTLEGEER